LQVITIPALTKSNSKSRPLSQLSTNFLAKDNREKQVRHNRIKQINITMHSSVGLKYHWVIMPAIKATSKRTNGNCFRFMRRVEGIAKLNYFNVSANYL